MAIKVATISIRVSRAQREWLRVYCRGIGVSEGEWLRRLIDEVRLREGLREG